MLPERPRRKLVLLVATQMFLGLLDLVAIGLVGILGAVAIAGMQSQPVGERVGELLRWVQLEEVSAQGQTAVLGVLTALIFLARTAGSIYLIRRALHFLGVRAAEASNNLIERLLSQPLTYLQTRSTQDFIFSVTTSVNSLVLGVLGAVVVMAADASVLALLGLALLITSPVIAGLAGLMFGILVVVLNRLTAQKAQHLGVELGELDVASRDTLMEALSTYRDMTVRGSKGHYASNIAALRIKAATANAEWVFLPNISKYVFETSVILGALIIGAVQFSLSDAQTAVATLAIFLAAGTRLAPAIMRLQQGSIALKGSAGQGTAALRLLAELPDRESEIKLGAAFTNLHGDFEPKISVRGATYRYPGAAAAAVQDLSLEISPGQMVAIVGPSGAGKSTAADLLMGVLQPDAGDVFVSGCTASDALKEWPGAVGYVPQDVWITEGSIRKNVSLGYEPSSVPDNAIWHALELAQLEDVVRGLPDELDAQAGERGAKFSGGQRQRLGIARAMVTAPRLVVLDEATSALDAETEHRISLALEKMRGLVTLVVIAHRLAVVRQADLVLYMEAGRVLARGSFDEVRAAVPNFDRQAALLGL